MPCSPMISSFSRHAGLASPIDALVRLFLCVLVVKLLLRQFPQRKQGMNVPISKVVAAGEPEVPVMAAGG